MAKECWSNDYIEPEEVATKYMPHQLAGLSYTASGYGSKIPTSKIARVGNRWYRIYCCVYSNNGTCFIVKNNKRFIVRD